MTVQYQNISPDSLINCLALDVTRKAVAELVPEEFDYIDELIRENDMLPETDDTLAFGVGELIAPLTPAIWSAVSAALTYCVTKLFDATVEVGMEPAKVWAKKKFGKENAYKGVLSLELEAEVHAMVISYALKCGLTEKQSARLSVLLIERLEGIANEPTD
ncbi:MAG: hypothetical protein Q8L15_12060 [Methylobacter sp.]|nr:hypothetical protein [Methylobacter sp.]